MELLVIRHGQSEADILGRHEGRADYQLTELGLKQAALLGDFIAKYMKPDFILSSPLKRAAKTAEIISQKTSVMIEQLDDLMEFNNGLLAGLTYKEAELKYPVPQQKRPHESYYEQETMIEFRSRAESVLSKIIYEYPQDKRIAIVSHGGMINMLFRSFLRLPFTADISIATADTSIHLWRIENENRSILFLNKTEHLNNL